ncbi:MAG: DUF4869 domain-containing protein [Clostridiales bacterium]|jgi:hypothetical protein|nr:DUF4869 domain-containing protein [Clostridiales bacterium]
MHIWLGKTEINFIDPKYPFRVFAKKSWFDDPFVKEMVADVDRCQVIDYQLTKNSRGQMMNTLNISGGAKSLILLYKCPNVLVQGNSMGDNCGKWLPVISEKSECYMTLTYGIMISEHINDLSPFNCEIINEGKTIGTVKEFYKEYYRILDKYQGFPAWKEPYGFFQRFCKGGVMM